MGLCYANRKYCLFVAILPVDSNHRAVVVDEKYRRKEENVCQTLMLEEAISPIVLLLVETVRKNVGPEELFPKM